MVGGPYRDHGAPGFQHDCSLRIPGNNRRLGIQGALMYAPKARLLHLHLQIENMRFRPRQLLVSTYRLSIIAYFKYLQVYLIPPNNHSCLVITGSPQAHSRTRM